MNKNRLALLTIKDKYNFTNQNLADKIGISNTTVIDFLREETDSKFQNLGCLSYVKLKTFLSAYGYNLDLKQADFQKVYGYGICDITGIENGKQMKYYETWKGMLRRCYSELYHKKEPTYKECSVCDEWLLFSNFKNGMMKTIMK